MWFVYITGHGKYEFEPDEQEEMTECVRDYLKTQQAEAITVIEGKDVTSSVLAEISSG